MPSGARSHGMAALTMRAMPAILEKAPAILDARGLRIALAEVLGEIVLGRVKAHELRAGGEEAIDLPDRYARG